MCHGLNLEYARHHGFLWEVTCEKRLVAGNILYTNNAIRANLNNLVHQLHGIAVGEQLADAVYVHDRLLVGIVGGCLNLMLANLLTDLSCELIINGMTWTSGNDATLDRLANEGHVANDVKQFVTGALVLPLQWLVLNIA